MIIELNDPFDYTGYRHMNLISVQGEAIPIATLFVHVSIKETKVPMGINNLKMCFS